MTNSGKAVKITVNASAKYDVFIGRNIIALSGEIIKSVVNKCKIALVTDDRVDSLYAETVIKSLEKEGYSVVKFVFPHGEESKNLGVYGEILSFLAKNELTRTDALVALGGGVVGDMAGFAAATYLRGIKYVQIPTTLLAQIDSSVGGKTAIDLKEGKNLVGAFYQPKAVICDIEVLNTLPDDIFLDGMGEAAKYAILDKRIFDLINGEEQHLAELVYLCIDYKRKIVEADEFEGGMRKLLNLGHTLAHGIERLSEYKIPHGRAVSMGLNIIIKNSLRHGFIDQKTCEEMLSVVEKCAGEVESPFEIKEACLAAFSDKKRSGDKITLVMVHGVGDCRTEEININTITEYLV